MGVPSAPTNVTAIPGNGNASVNFNASTYLGGASVVSYIINTYNSNSNVQIGTPVTVSSTSASISGLPNGTSIYFTVTAYNGIGYSGPSSQSNHIIPVGTPGSPSIVLVEKGNSEAIITFTGPEDTGGVAIESYTIYTYNYNTNDQIGYQVVTSSPVTVTGLSNGTAVYFTITAYNGFYTGLPGLPSSTIIPVGIPSAPTDVSAYPGNGEAIITFTAPLETGGVDIVNYNVTIYDNITKEQIGSQTISSSNSSITGLTNAQAVYFMVSSYNGTNYSTNSLASNSITPYGIPSEVQNVHASVSSTTATVTWNAPTYFGDASSISYTIVSSGGVSKSVNQETTSVSFTGLTYGTNYTFDVTASNSLFSSPIVTSNSIMPTTVPGIPNNVSVSAGQQNITVSFKPPTSNGYKTITGYSIRCGGLENLLNVSSLTVSGSGSGTTYSSIITGLTQGVVYAIEVAAVNANGTGTYSSSLTTTPFGSPVNAPTNLIASPSNQSIVLTWTQPSNIGNSSITNYNIYYSANGGSVLHISTNNGNSTATIPELTNGAEYSFYISAQNSYGTGPASSTATGIPNITPNKPTSIVATTGNQSASISWTAPTSNGATIDSYIVSYDSNSAHNVTVSGSTTSAIVSSLVNGSSYSFYVTAVNNVGSNKSATSSNTIIPNITPNAPSSITAVAGNQSASISWTAPTSNGATIDSYIVSYDSNTGHNVTVSGSTTSATISSLVNGTSYTFYVTAVNNVGSTISTSSNSIRPNLIPNAPTNINATSAHQTATVTWTTPASNGAYIDNYMITYDNNSAHSITVPGTSNSATIPNLINGNLYSFYVTSINNFGTNQSTSSSSSVEPNIAPNVPLTVNATSGRNRYSVVTWVQDYSNGAYIDSYTVEYKLSTALDYTLYSTVSGTTNSITVSGLTNTIPTTFRITAINNKGSASTVSNIITPDTPPNTVTGFSASIPQIIGTVNLTWTPATSSGSAVTGYILYWNSLSRNIGNVTSYSLTDITTTGVPTNISINAYNTNGNGSYSTITTTPLGVPLAPTITQVIGKQGVAIVKYSPNSNTGGLSITGYTITAYNTDGTTIVETQASASSTSTMVTGLVGGSNVQFKVTSTNSLGTSPASTLSSITPIKYTCFHSSTKVLSFKNNEDVYIPINQLEKGNLIKTYKHGYIKILGIQKSLFQNDNISFSSSTPKHLYKLSKNSYPELTEDLILTGIHSLLVDNLTEKQYNEIAKENENKHIYITDDKYRLFTYLDPKAELYNDEIGIIEIWNIALENTSNTKNYGIYVNGGLLVESLPISML